MYGKFHYKRVKFSFWLSVYCKQNKPIVKSLGNSKTWYHNIHVCQPSLWFSIYECLFICLSVCLFIYLTKHNTNKTKTSRL